MYNVILWRCGITIVALKRNITFQLSYSRPACSCQRYKTVECCNGNARMGSLCTAVELKIFPVALTSTDVLRYSCAVPNTVVRLVWEFEFLDRFRESPQYQISRKSVKREPSCHTRTDKRTDMTKRVDAFRYLCECA